MRRIFKTQEAETDLEDIWLYSFEEWNEEQCYFQHYLGVFVPHYDLQN